MISADTLSVHELLSTQEAKGEESRLSQTTAILTPLQT